MQVSYNLRYQKFNFANKNILDKEGEIVVYEKGFRLKGKGANDKGELLNFAEIKEFYSREEKIFFITFGREKYVLSDSGTLFDNLLSDLFRSRNEFLLDALFMKGGKLKAEFDGNFVRQSKFGKTINRGRGKIRLYEYSMVIMPVDQDAFSLHYDFINFHEFDEMEYLVKVVMDNGVNLVLSNFGNDYSVFEEKLNEILGGMYETFVNDGLKLTFPQFHAGTLLKLAYFMKGGKAVAYKEIKKIDSDLAESLENFVLEEDELRARIGYLRQFADSNGVMFGLVKDRMIKDSFVRWVLVSMPEHNLMAFAVLPRWQENGKNGVQNEQMHTPSVYFYRIIIEKGRPADKVEDKLNEINQALVNLHFVKDPCYKDKRELKHSPYKYAIRKLPYLRILRKSYVGKAGGPDQAEFQKQVERIFAKAKVS